MKRFLLILFILLSFFNYAKSIKLPSIFGDNMVLQQDFDVPVWGKSAEPGDEIIVECAGITVKTRAQADGTWECKLPLTQRKGIHTFRVISPDTIITYNNVLIGDVWFASGQSNMSFSVLEGDNANREIMSANYPEIRFFNVKTEVSQVPLDDVVGHWEICSPQNAGSISAVAYFFGKELYKDKKFPVGLIISAWGASNLQSFTSREMISAEPFFKKELALRDQEGEDWYGLHQQYHRDYRAIYGSHRGEELKVHTLNYKPKDWAETTFPMNVWGMKLGYYGGFFWTRKEFELPADFSRKSAILDFGSISGQADVYINGVKIESGKGGYVIPEKVLRPGKRNLVAIRLFSFYGSGNIGGWSNFKARIAIEEKSFEIPAEKWLFSAGIEPSFPVFPPHKNYPSALFNAMISPVIPYGIKGFLWYQGESNDSRPLQYARIFPLLINDWRIRWKQDFTPFLFVQLANFKESQPEPADENWSYIREAQSLALNLPNTAMAVTIDIGDAKEIHPKNKQDVGKRLYLCAKNKVYGDTSIQCSGPIYDSCYQKDGRITVRFKEIGLGLTTPNGEELKGFAIAGSDRKFYWARAEIQGNEVILFSDQVPTPVAIRYAWASNPVCNLYNKDGLPASPFRTDCWNRDGLE